MIQAEYGQSLLLMLEAEVQLASEVRTSVHVQHWAARKINGHGCQALDRTNGYDNREPAQNIDRTTTARPVLRFIELFVIEPGVAGGIQPTLYRGSNR